MFQAVLSIADFNKKKKKNRKHQKRSNNNASRNGIRPVIRRTELSCLRFPSTRATSSSSSPGQILRRFFPTRENHKGRGRGEASFVQQPSPGRDHRASAGSRFNSNERLPFAPPLFAGQSGDPRGARARTSCGSSRREGRITIRPISRAPCHRCPAEEGEKEREERVRDTRRRKPPRVFTYAFTYARRTSPDKWQVVRVNAKAVNRVPPVLREGEPVAMVLRARLSAYDVSRLHKHRLFLSAAAPFSLPPFLPERISSASAAANNKVSKYPGDVARR